MNQPQLGRCDVSWSSIASFQENARFYLVTGGRHTFLTIGFIWYTQTQNPVWSAIVVFPSVYLNWLFCHVQAIQFQRDLLFCFFDLSELPIITHSLTIVSKHETLPRPRSKSDAPVVPKSLSVDSGFKNATLYSLIDHRPPTSYHEHHHHSNGTIASHCLCTLLRICR